MPGMVASSGRGCSRYRSGPSAQWLLLLGAIVGCSFAVASGSTEPGGRHADVDLIWPLGTAGPKSRDPSIDVIRQRLVALERRFTRSNAHTGDEQTIVFFQLHHATSGHARTASDEDDILTMAVETFSSRPVRGCTIFRFAPVLPAGAAGASPSVAMASVASAGRVVLVLLLLPDLTSFSQTLVRQSTRAFPLATTLVLLASSGDLACPDEPEQGTVRSVWRNLWLTERVLSALAVWYRCSESRGMPIGRYDPFPSQSANEGCRSALPTGDGQPTEGTFHVAPNLDRPLSNDPRLNLNRAPLDIYGFEAAMAYRRKDIDMLPRTFAPQLAERRCNLTSAGADEGSGSYLNGLFGADIEALRELATRMNFTPRVHYTRANFGFRAANGSFTGVLGRLVTTRESWLSMNVYFLKDYETRDVQFTAAVYQDSLCVFVKAAGMLPDWLLIFRCFTPTLWIMVWGTVALVSLCYVLLSQLIATRQRDRSGEKNQSAGGRETAAPDPVQVEETVGLVGQIVGALLSAPTDGINRTSAHQKLFVAFGLIWGMTMTGAFQGSLVDVYTTPTSMKNLDTLAELDASGLPIAVNAPALIVDVFGTERPGNTIGNLKRRLVLEENPTQPAGHTVLGGRTAALIRNQDFVRLSTKYLGSDGHARLHRLRECPRSYTLAYLYPRGSPLYVAANWHILHFLQHGLYAKWERDATHTLAMNRAFKVRQFVDRSRTQAGQVQLRLGHLLVPFMLLAGGLSLAGVIFACEHLRLMCSSREKTTATVTS